MMKIKSDPVKADAPASKVFDFLSNFNNYQKLMPEQVIKWESDAKAGRFTIEGLTGIGLRIEDAVPGTYVLLHSDGKVPFDFTLRFTLADEGDQTEVSCEFDGNVSPMIAMMAKRPLTNLVNHMVGEIPKHV